MKNVKDVLPVLPSSQEHFSEGKAVTETGLAGPQGQIEKAFTTWLLAMGSPRH